MHSTATSSSAGRRGWLKRLGALLAGGTLLGRRAAAAPAEVAGIASTQGLDSFLGEIMLISFNFAPKNWALCNGQLLPISSNQALFSLLGTTYGGNGQTNFALPDLRGRVPVAAGNSVLSGTAGGEVAHTLLRTEMPAHLHGMKASLALGTGPLSSTGTTPTYLADNGGGNPQYGAASAIDTNLATSNGNSGAPPVNISSNAGGSQAHLNMQPSLVLNYVISLTGTFPSPA
jgi:microcystin-dependent protein